MTQVVARKIKSKILVSNKKLRSRNHFHVARSHSNRVKLTVKFLDNQPDCSFTDCIYAC
jgi:hypothetical protein